MELDYLKKIKPATSGEVKDNSNHETLAVKDKPRRQTGSTDNIPQPDNPDKENARSKAGDGLSILPQSSNENILQQDNSVKENDNDDKVFTAARLKIEKKTQIAKKMDFNSLCEN